MMPLVPLAACRAARMPAAGLDALAALRATGGIAVCPGDPAWVTWEGDRPEVIAAILPVPGVEWFEARDGRWFRPGAHLPAFDVPPAGEALPLDRVVYPAAIEPREPTTGEPRRVPLKLVRAEMPRSTSAIRCPVAALQAWADRALTAEITAVKAARCGDVAWLLGSEFPGIARAERFWGERVLVPLGFRTEPDWPEAALREAAGIGPDEILVLRDGQAEAIPADAFRPLTRGAIRRALHR